MGYGYDPQDATPFDCPDPPCEGCQHSSVPGVRPEAGDGTDDPPPGFVVVERCDTCELFEDDLAAARAWGAEATWHDDGERSYAIAKPPVGSDVLGSPLDYTI